MTDAVVVNSWRPLAAVLVSTVAVAFIVASYRRQNVRELWSVIAALTKFGIVISMLPGVMEGTEYRWSLGMVPGLTDEFVFGIEYDRTADALAGFDAQDGRRGAADRGLSPGFHLRLVRG